MSNDVSSSTVNALVTGAARGIGFAIAQTLADQSVNVGLVDLAGAEDAAVKLAEQFPAQRFAGFTVDVRSAEQVRECAGDFCGTFGSIDVLVNNAGTASRAGLDTINATEWTRDLETNLNGAFHFIQSVVFPYMADAASGSIINIASISGINGGAVSSGDAGARSGPAYAASKGGIIALTKWVAKEVGHLGIRCNSVAPGPVESEMTAGQAYDLGGQAIRRMGRPSDIAHATAFLASPRADFITGQVLRVDGGAVMA